MDASALSRGDLADSWFAVLNPVSAGGRGCRDRARIEGALRAAGIDYELAVSERDGHAVELAAEAVRAGHRRLLAIGGDGTLHQLLNGALTDGAMAAPGLSFGLLPVGGANDWARAHRIPKQYAAAAAVIAAGHVTAHDVGMAEWRADRDRGPVYFLNVAGAGFDGYLVTRVGDARWGSLRYVAALPAAFASYRAPDLTVSSSTRSCTGRTFVAFVAIGRYCGGGMCVAPQAAAADGLFDVVVIEAISAWDLVRDVRRLFDGSIQKYNKAHCFRAPSVEITGPRPVAVEADGERLPPTPIRFTVLPEQVNVVVPSYRPPATQPRPRPTHLGDHGA